MRGGSLILGLTVSVGLLLWACGGDDPVSPPESEPFSFEVMVIDTLGHSIEGLQVSAWNHLSGLAMGKPVSNPAQAGALKGHAALATADPNDVGDINCDGYAYGIADLIMYVQYFTQGLGAFGDHAQESVAASDINGDGTPLTLADMVYLNRKVTGDAAPVPPTDTAYAYLVYDSTTGSLSVSGPLMGGALVTVRGENLVESALMESDWYFDGTYSRTCLYGLNAGESFSGWFLDVDSQLVEVELATYDGNPVQIVIQALQVAFAQNYPNPFNGSTTVGFAVPVEHSFEMTIKNVHQGQVYRITDTLYAGAVNVDWNGSGLANGVYTCHLSVRDFLHDEILIADSQYIIVWAPDASKNVFGYTAASGTFVTSDSLAFPSLQTWPDFVRTDESGMLLGTFGFSDTITIVLTDTLSDEYQSYERVLSRGRNGLELTWDQSLQP